MIRIQLPCPHKAMTLCAGRKLERCKLWIKKHNERYDMDLSDSH
jgi:hypothetical protein